MKKTENATSAPSIRAKLRYQKPILRKIAGGGQKADFCH